MAEEAMTEKPQATDDEFAAELLRRLNAMVQNPDVLRDFSELLKVRIPASNATEDHPSIICGEGTFSAFGILNGLCGPPIKEGRGKGCGRLMRYVNDDGNETIRFWLSKDEPPADCAEAMRIKAEKESKP